LELITIYDVKICVFVKNGFMNACTH